MFVAVLAVLAHQQQTAVRELEFAGDEADPVRVAYTIQVLLDPKLLDGVLLRLQGRS